MGAGTGEFGNRLRSGVMWLNIHGHGLVVDAAARERAGRRLGFALGRFGDRVGQVAVHLSDVNGPRGGVDKRCRVVVELPGHGPVVVEEADADLDALIDRAADRVGRAVVRRLVRARLFSHPRP
ncbi:MAG: 30S ribosomal protein S30 [Isosphaera sp.]|nr:30S ribosomal protein S30 [Isosphaera sp.]